MFDFDELDELDEAMADEASGDDCSTMEPHAEQREMEANQKIATTPCAVALSAVCIEDQPKPAKRQPSPEPAQVKPTAEQKPAVVQDEADERRKVVAHVDFCIQGQTWAHEFEIERGTTILALKRRMTASKPDEASWFELRRLGRRVPDHEVILSDVALDFFFVGPASPDQVEVVVRHAVDTEHEVSVRVLKEASVLDLRRAAAEALGEKASSIKIVSRMSGSCGFSTMTDNQLLGNRREFMSTCEALRQKC